MKKVTTLSVSVVAIVLSIVDPQGNKFLTVDYHTNPRGVALDPLSGSLYVSNNGPKTVLKYSV